MVQDDSISATALASADALERVALERVENSSRRRLALMRQLQASLAGSRKALLELDLAGIGRGTGEQIELNRMLAEEIQRDREPSAIPKRETFKKECASGTEEELRQSERDVLHALRLQAVLLARMRSKLCVLANMLADRSVNYGPLLEQNGVLPHAFRGHRGGERDQCRA